MIVRGGILLSTLAAQLTRVCTHKQTREPRRATHVAKGRIVEAVYGYKVTRSVVVCPSICVLSTQVIPAKTNKPSAGQFGETI